MPKMHLARRGPVFAVPVAATGRLDDGIERGQVAMHDRKTEIDSGLDQLGGDDDDRSPLPQQALNQPDPCPAILRCQVGREGDQRARREGGVQGLEQGAYRPPPVDDDEGSPRLLVQGGDQSLGKCVQRQGLAMVRVEPGTGHGTEMRVMIRQQLDRVVRLKDERSGGSQQHETGTQAPRRGHEQLAQGFPITQG